MEIIERNEQNEEIAVPSLENADAKEIALRCVAILDEKKAHDIRLLRVEDQTVLANYFVICTGTSNTQLRALAGELEYKLGLAKQPPLRIEATTRQAGSFWTSAASWCISSTAPHAIFINLKNFGQNPSRSISPR